MKSGDCFVASLLAMTDEKTFYEVVKVESAKFALTFKNRIGVDGV